MWNQMARKKVYSDPLDELLDKLSNGDFVDQSVHEFNETVNDTVKGYQDSKRSKGTARSYTRSTYSTKKPVIIAAVETAQYDSRYDQVIACLSNLDFTGYAAGKKDGYQQAIDRYLELVKEHGKDLRKVEIMVSDDLSTCLTKMRSVTVDGYTQGYYDALGMVKKVLYNSKLARLRELSNKLK